MERTLIAEKKHQKNNRGGRGTQPKALPHQRQHQQHRTTSQPLCEGKLVVDLVVVIANVSHVEVGGVGKDAGVPMVLVINVLQQQ